MINDNLTAQALSETTAIRLFNSVAATEATMATTTHLNMATDQRTSFPSDKSISSVQSANQSGQSCRICRWNRSDMEVTRCPCYCKGTVGFIHMQCLKRWIMHRRSNHCEICHGSFVIPEEKINIGRMFRSLCIQCAGPIVKHTLFGLSLVPLAHIVLQQVLFCMETLNQSPYQQQLAVSEIIVASCALLTSSALFFHYFEFITSRLLAVRYILRHWWSFGNSNDFPVIELDSEMLEFFN